MKSFRIISLVIGLSFFSPAPVHATSFGFVRDAIREYKQNPTPENEAKMRRASRLAGAMVFAFWSMPVVLVLYLIVRFVRNGYKLDRIKRSS